MKRFFPDSCLYYERFYLLFLCFSVGKILIDFYFLVGNILPVFLVGNIMPYSYFIFRKICLMATSRASLGLIPFCTSISAFQIKMWTLNKNTMITILIFVIVVSDQWGRCSRSQRRSWAQSVREGRRSRCWTGWDAWGVELVGTCRHVNMFICENLCFFCNGNISLVNWQRVCKLNAKLWIQKWQNDLSVFNYKSIDEQIFRIFQSNQIWKNNCLSKSQISNT